MYSKDAKAWPRSNRIESGDNRHVVMEAWWSASRARWVTWCGFSLPYNTRLPAVDRHSTTSERLYQGADLLEQREIGTVSAWATRARSLQLLVTTRRPGKPFFLHPLHSLLLPRSLCRYSRRLETPSVWRPVSTPSRNVRVVIEPRSDTKGPFNDVQRSSLRGPGHRLVLAWPQYRPLADAARCTAGLECISTRLAASLFLERNAPRLYNIIASKIR